MRPTSPAPAGRADD